MPGLGVLAVLAAPPAILHSFHNVAAVRLRKAPIGRKLLMPDFLERLRAPDNYRRSVILFGRNVASYKFALAQSLLELSANGDSYISLQDLALPFSRKSARLPEQRFLERLHTRNEFLISSHHPLRETLIAQTGDSTEVRAKFLNTMYVTALGALIHRWSPKSEYEAAF